MIFSEYSLPLIFVVSLVAILGAGELGRAIGRRVKIMGGDNISTLQGAVLGLLALMIGFTFAMALSRYDSRRDAVLKEANSIGTVALRARLLPAPHDTEALRLLQEYTKIRLDLTERVPSMEEFKVSISRSNAIQETLWQQVKVLAAKDNAMVPTGVYIQSLNEMIDNQETRLAAAFNRLPNVVLIALYSICLIAIGFSGYGGGLDSRRAGISTAIMGILVCCIVLMIQDLDRPGVGLIKVSQQAMINTHTNISNYLR